MRTAPRTVVVAALVACPLLARPFAVRGDVVKLTNGRSIVGVVSSETADEVTVDTTSGRLVLRRKLIASIVRDTAAEKLLREARSLARAGDPEADVKYRAAVEAAERSGEGKVCAAATAELAAMRARAGAAAAAEASPYGRPPVPDSASVETAPPTGERPTIVFPDPPAPPSPAEARENESALASRDVRVFLGGCAALGQRAFLLRENGRPEDALALVERVRAACARRQIGDVDLEPKPTPSNPERGRGREAVTATALAKTCRIEAGVLALRRGSGRHALELVAPIASDSPADLRNAPAAYLVGRAQEWLGQPDEARATFRNLIGTRVPLDGDDSLHRLRLLAHQLAYHFVVSDGSPGVGSEWRHTDAGRHCLIHQGDVPPGVVAEIESVRARVLARLGWRDSVATASPWLPVVLYRDNHSWGMASGFNCEGSFHRMLGAGDGRSFPAVSFVNVDPPPLLGAAIDHVVAHTLLDDATGGALLPAWATEGIASYCETEPARRRSVAAVARFAAGKQLESVASFLACGGVPDTRRGFDLGQDAIRFGYPLAIVNVLVARAGSVRRLVEVAVRHPGAAGLQALVRELGFEGMPALEAEVAAFLRNAPPPPPPPPPIRLDRVAPASGR